MKIKAIYTELTSWTPPAVLQDQLVTAALPPVEKHQEPRLIKPLLGTPHTFHGNIASFISICSTCHKICRTETPKWNKIPREAESTLSNPWTRSSNFFRCSSSLASVFFVMARLWKENQTKKKVMERAITWRKSKGFSTNGSKHAHEHWP